MRIKFKPFRSLLSSCILPIIGLTLAITPAIGAQDKPANIELKELNVKMTGGTLQLRRYIDLKVEKLPDWLKQPGKQLSQLELYIDGVEFKGLQPSMIGADTLR